MLAAANASTTPRLVRIASPMKAAGKQPRFADVGKNCAVLVEIGSARTCLPPAAPAARRPEITEKKFLIRKAATRKTLRVLGLSRPGGQVVKIMSPRRPKPGETPGRRVSADALQCWLFLQGVSIFDQFNGHAHAMCVGVGAVVPVSEILFPAPRGGRPTHLLGDFCSRASPPNASPTALAAR